MKSVKMESVLFNLAGAFVLVTVFGYVITSEFRTKTAQSCAARYPGGQQFSLENAKGALLTPIEFQAQAGTREWGVLKNTRITRAKDVPLGEALEVSLETTDNEDQADQNGLGYAWLVNMKGSPSSACLSYSVFLPENFKFSEPGYLPGLFGAGDLGALDQIPPVGGAIARMGWISGGELGVEVRNPSTTGYWLGGMSYSGANTHWATGRWVAIQQEVKLNSPGHADGIVRVWVDGELKIEGRELDLRGSDQFALSGVVADIGYARAKAETAVIKVSPFIVQWQ